MFLQSRKAIERSTELRIGNSIRIKWTPFCLRLLRKFYVPWYTVHTTICAAISLVQT